MPGPGGTKKGCSIAWIEWNPELFPRKYRFFRRAVIRNTYFGVVPYYEEKDAIRRLTSDYAAEIESGFITLVLRRR
jgi:hypothetical protein